MGCVFITHFFKWLQVEALPLNNEWEAWSQTHVEGVVALGPVTLKLLHRPPL